MLDLEHTEIDRLLYPIIETGMGEIENHLSKYGILRLWYLHEHKREMYHELLMTGKLSEQCTAIDKIAFEQSEQIQANWLKKNPMLIEDTLEHIRLWTQAQAIADKIVLAELICTTPHLQPKGLTKADKLTQNLTIR